MTELILLCLTIFVMNGLYIIGLNTVTDYDENIDESKMIFWKVRYYAKLYFGDFWSKPICSCPPCMTSLHTIYIYFPIAITLFGFNSLTAILWPVYALSLAGFIKLINR